MYSVNGIALDNASAGWWLSSKTAPFPGFTNNVPVVAVPSRDGAFVPPGAITMQPRPWKIVVRTTVAGLESLMSLFTSKPLMISKTATPSRRVTCTLLSISDPEVFNIPNDANTRVDVTVMVQIDSAAWRDAAETTSPPATVSGGTVQVNGLWPGMSAPVQDCVIRIKGYTAAPISVTDSGGSWFKFDGRELLTGQYLLFAAAAGTAVLSTFATSWDDYNEDVSGLVDFGGPRGVFEITPAWDSDPSVRAGRVVLTTATPGAPGFSPSIEIRGKGAYLV